MMARAATWALAALFLSACDRGGEQADVIAPPAAAGAVNPDGRFAEEEWGGAATREIAPRVRIHFLQDARNLYVGIRASEEEIARYVDMFVSVGSAPVRNLHASMQIGERALPERGWTDAAPKTSWGISAGWLANVVTLAPDRPEALPFRERVTPYDGFEFVISKELFGSAAVRIRIEIRDFEGKAADLIFSSASDRFEPNSWALLQMSS